MKKIGLSFSLIFLFTISLLAFRGNGGKGHFVVNGNSKDWGVIYSIIDTMKKEPLSKDEIKGLVKMREEEKLARDVYMALYEKWGLRIFRNISESENRHTRAIQHLLIKYGIKDPVKEDKKGIFEDKELRSLYKDLVEKGERSLLDALIVGAMIEDLDIYDIKNLKIKTDNKDIKLVYENLEKGSRNHMRSFTKQIKYNGGNIYKAKYLTQSQVDSIINTPNERGIYNWDGKPISIPFNQ